MSSDPETGPVEFIRLNGHPVRATSWQAGKDAETWRLVAIMRGSGDAATLANLLESPSLMLEIPDQQTTPVVVQSIERRETGGAPATITRLVVEFARKTGDESPTAPELSMEERVTALEAEVAQLRKVVTALSNGSNSEAIPRIDRLP